MPEGYTSNRKPKFRPLQIVVCNFATGKDVWVQICNVYAAEGGHSGYNCVSLGNFFHSGSGDHVYKPVRWKSEGALEEHTVPELIKSRAFRTQKSIELFLAACRKP